MMSFIYETMDRAKEVIQEAFNDNEEKFKDIFAIIDGQKIGLTTSPPFASIKLLSKTNFFYTNPNIDNNDEVVDDLYQCIDYLVKMTNRKSSQIVAIV